MQVAATVPASERFAVEIVLGECGDGSHSTAAGLMRLSRRFAAGKTHVKDSCVSQRPVSCASCGSLRRR